MMTCYALHNLCISVSDPCKPKWKFHVRNLGLIKKHIIRNESTEESNLNRMKIGFGWIIDWKATSSWKNVNWTFFNKKGLNLLQKKRLAATIIFIIFWDSLMLNQIFLSPQVKRCTIITYEYGIYVLAHELPTDLRLRILEN